MQASLSRTTDVEMQFLQNGDWRLGVRAGLLLFGVAMVVLLPGIQVSLFDRDEGWYAQVCREMVQTGDWLIPRYLGEVWLAKPPLTYWLVAGSYRLFGVGEWQARLVPVLATGINVVLVAVLATGMFGRRVGVLAGLLFITSGLPAIVGKMLLTDAVMLLCTLTAVLLHYRMSEAGEGSGFRVQGSDPKSEIRNPKLTGGGWGDGKSSVRLSHVDHLHACAYWVAIGLGILAKGPATLVFAGAFALALLATPERRGWIRDWRWWVWMPMALLVAAPWYVYIAHHAGDILGKQFLGYEIKERIAGTPHGHGGPPGYYLLLSLAGLLPWTVFVPGTLILAFRRRREDRTLRLLLIWLAVPWVALELIHAKLPHYIMPCYVPLAILMGRLLDESVRSYVSWTALPRIERRILDLWPGIMVGVGAIVIAGALIRWNSRWGWAAVTTGAVLVGGFLMVARLLHRRGPAVAGVAAFVPAVGFYVVVGVWLLPAIEPFRLSRNLAVRMTAEAAGGPMYLCGYEEPSVFFYQPCPARPVWRERRSDDAPELTVEELLASVREPSLLGIVQRDLGRLPAEVVAQIRPRLLPEPVEGFNYVKGSWETIWLARIGGR